MNKKSRNIGQGILSGLQEIKRGEYGQATTLTQQGHDKASEKRDMVTQLMTPAQIAEAERRARE